MFTMWLVGTLVAVSLLSFIMLALWEIDRRRS